MSKNSLIKQHTQVCSYMHRFLLIEKFQMSTTITNNNKNNHIIIIIMFRKHYKALVALMLVGKAR